MNPYAEAFFQGALDDIIKETGEGCPLTLNQSILEVLQQHDQKYETELAFKYRNQCHEPLMILRPNDGHQKPCFGAACNEDWIVECVCKPCCMNGYFIECNRVYPLAAKKVLELVVDAFEKKIFGSEPGSRIEHEGNIPL